MLWNRNGKWGKFRYDRGNIKNGDKLRVMQPTMANGRTRRIYPPTASDRLSFFNKLNAGADSTKKRSVENAKYE